MIASGDTAQAAGDQPYSTGNPELDLVMSGGFPGGALSMIIGPPGAGKTVLAAQLAFAAARAGHKVVYLTTVSESHARLIKHIRALAFFEEQLLTRSLNLVSINTAIQSQGSEATINFIAGVARDAQAGLVVIDSYHGLQQMIAADSQKRRETLFNLMARLRLLGASTVLVGEYPAAAVGGEPEFAVADCVIELAYEIQGMRRRRLLSVLKMRGTAFLEGLHPCAITARGLEVFPRLESLPAPAPVPADRPADLVSTGVAGLDAMLGGGLPGGSSLLLAGPPGTGKSLLGLHFLAAAPPGEAGLLVTFQEALGLAEARAAAFGLELGPAGGRQRLHALPLGAGELIADEVALRLRQLLAATPIARIVIDPLEALLADIADPQRARSFASALVDTLRAYPATALLISERQPGAGAPYAVDAVVETQRVHVGGALTQAIAALKTREAGHDPSLRQLRIAAGRLAIGPRFAGGFPGVPGLELEPSSEE